MIICVCHRVSHHDISRAVREGCPSFEALQAQLQVGTRCGACRGCARETFEAHGPAEAPAVAAQPAARVHPATLQGLRRSIAERRADVPALAA
jgi:bacterioferritin-associated ferredoxin